MRPFRLLLAIVVLLLTVQTASAIVMQVRRDTAANWTKFNPVLAPGELAYELPVSTGVPGMMKIGDGKTPWRNLLYLPVASNIGITGVSSYNGQTGDVAGVSYFNGQSGAVTGVSSYNGQTGPVTGVSSVNGQTGDVTINLVTTDVMASPYYGNLTALVTAVGSQTAEVLIDGQAILSANTTIPGTMSLTFSRRGYINTNGKHLDIYGSIHEPHHQIFTGAGSVTFAVKPPNILPQWWGYTPGDYVHDQSQQLQSAIDQGGHVTVPPGDARYNVVIAKEGLDIDFNGATGQNRTNPSVARPYDLSLPVVTIGNDVDYTTMTIKGLNINSETSPGSGIHGTKGLKITGGAWNDKFFGLSVKGSFSDYGIGYIAGNNMPTSQIDIYGIDAECDSGYQTSAFIDMVPNTDELSYDPNAETGFQGTFQTGFRVFGGNIVGCGGFSDEVEAAAQASSPYLYPTIRQKGVAIELYGVYGDYAGYHGIQLLCTPGGYCPRFVQTGGNIDPATNGPVIENRAQYDSGGYTHNVALGDVVSLTNVSGIGGGQVYDNGTMVNWIGSRDTMVYPMSWYPIVLRSLLFPTLANLFDTSMNIQHGDNGDFYMSNNSANIRLNTPSGQTIAQAISSGTSTTNSMVVNSIMKVNNISDTSVADLLVTSSGQFTGTTATDYTVKIVSNGVTSGSELYSNGSFGDSSTITAWQRKYQTADLTWQSPGSIRLVKSDSSSTLGPYAKIHVSVTPGKSYRIAVNFKTAPAHGNTFLSVNDTDSWSGGIVARNMHTTGTNTIGFVATGADCWIQVSGSAVWQVGDYAEFDDLSIKESTASDTKDSFQWCEGTYSACTGGGTWSSSTQITSLSNAIGTSGATITFKAGIGFYAGNTGCTASSTPWACCTGTGTGTCTPDYWVIPVGATTPITVNNASSDAIFSVDSDGNTSIGGSTVINGLTTLSGSGPITPSHTATCTAGTIWWDSGYIYVCTASGTVKRATLSAF